MSVWTGGRALCAQEEAFVGAVLLNPRDHATRLVYADWLEDEDRPEDADLQRATSAAAYDEAEAYLRGYHERLSYARAYNYPPGDPGLDPADYQPPFSFEEMIQGAHEHLDGGWGLTLPYNTPDFVYGEAGEFWRHFTTYTGRRTSGHDGRFLSCSC